MGRPLASCSDDGTVRVWDVNSGSVQRVFRGHTNRYIRGLAAHPDGWRLASSATDGTIKLWDLAARSQEYAALRADLHGNLPPQFSRPIFVKAVFSPDSRLLACPSRDGTVQVWEVGTQKLHCVFRRHRSEVWGLAFTPDGCAIVSGDYTGVLHLWEPDTGRLQHTFAGRRAGIHAVTIDRDGRRLACACTDGTLLLWDLAGRAPLHTFAAHRGATWDVIFSSDGRLLASSGDDGLIKLWDVKERTLRRTLEGHGKTVTRLAFRRDGRCLASGGRTTTSGSGIRTPANCCGPSTAIRTSSLASLSVRTDGAWPRRVSTRRSSFGTRRMARKSSPSDANVSAFTTWPSAPTAAGWLRPELKEPCASGTRPMTSPPQPIQPSRRNI